MHSHLTDIILPSLTLQFLEKKQSFLNIFSFLKTKNVSTVCEEIWKFLKSKILNSKKKTKKQRKKEWIMRNLRLEAIV